MLNDLLSSFLRWVSNGKFSGIWVYIGLVFALYNWLIKGYATNIDMMLTCFMITFYFLSRICEELERR